MTTKQFVKDVKYLFSNAFYYTVDNERPETVASSKESRKFTALLKSLFPDCIIHHDSHGFCEDSAFVEKDGHFVYISIGDFRFWPNWDQDVLIRTAANAKDFTGGYNNRTTMEKIVEDVYKLLNEEHKPMR